MVKNSEEIHHFARTTENSGKTMKMLTAKVQSEMSRHHDFRNHYWFKSFSTKTNFYDHGFLCTKPQKMIALYTIRKRSEDDIIAWTASKRLRAREFIGNFTILTNTVNAEDTISPAAKHSSYNSQNGLLLSDPLIFLRKEVAAQNFDWHPLNLLIMNICNDSESIWLFRNNTSELHCVSEDSKSYL